MSTCVYETSDKTFETEVLKAKEVVLVDFWAEWCGPCKMISSILEEIAREMVEKYRDRFKVYKLNVDNNQETTQMYNVRGIPCLIVFQDGEEKGRKVGAVSKSELLKFVETYL